MKEPMSTDMIREILFEISLWFFEHDQATEDLKTFLKNRHWSDEAIEDFIEGNF